MIVALMSGSTPMRIASASGKPPVREPGAGSGDMSAAAPLKRRILIVEDEYFVALELEEILLDGGYEVVGVAASGSEASAIAGAQRPDLILMDIRLAGNSDGIETATQILHQYAIPSIFVSAHADAGTKARAESAAPRGWVAKPFNRSELLTAVRRAFMSDA